MKPCIGTDRQGYAELADRLQFAVLAALNDREAVKFEAHPLYLECLTARQGWRCRQIWLPFISSGQAYHVGPGLARLALARMLAPFISQTTTSPLEFCHRMSDLPSLL